MEKNTVIEECVREGCPNYAIIYMEADVRNGETSVALRSALEDTAAGICAEYAIEEIKNRRGIASTRQAYKAFGKDPNRYRPSQEQLMRRVVRGLGLYNVNGLVDTGNLLSLATGYSVGVFDRDSIAGGEIRVGVGRQDESYEGIGRGHLNISGMPVIRDAEGGFGTPTSDHERTKTDLGTKHVSVTMHVFDTTGEDLDYLCRIMRELFATYCSATGIVQQITYA